MTLSADVHLPSFIQIGKDICTDLAAAEEREWLVTNGIGGFACGTLAGTLSRRYHGLLIAALDPPRNRTLLVTKADEILRAGGDTYALSANRWASGAIDPTGYRYLESVRLEGAIPVWTYICGGTRIEKRIWMEHGANTTYVRYAVSGATQPVDLELKVLVNYRDFNSLTHAGDWRMRLEPIERGVKITAFDGAVPFYLHSAGASAQLADSNLATGGPWYRDYELSQEEARGFDHHEDHLLAAIFHATLEPGSSVSLVCSTGRGANVDAERALDAELSRQSRIIALARDSSSNRTSTQPAWFDQLALAADSFVVNGESPSQQPGIIAGYPWFGVWSRDALISVPGLLLATGRPEVAREILDRFARALDGGMLPNFFPESGVPPQFNSVDAPLWFVEAVREYAVRTGDQEFAREMIPPISGIVSAYIQGTRFGIHADSADGLLYAGGPGTQLTWMDARAEGIPVTPRVGKPVEINALWLNAVATIADLAEGVGRPVPVFRRLAGRIRASFAKFWNPARNCCFDVIDGPQGNDPRLRPNQIFAASLRVSGLTAEQQRAVVDVCGSELHTPFGLRSLGPKEAGYRGRYEGGENQRDAAYHQGTVWMWLLGPYLTAHFNVYRDLAAAKEMVDSAASQLATGALGNLNEIFDGDPPFTPRGCFAQAWSVAELFRAWDFVCSQTKPK